MHGACRHHPRLARQPGIDQWAAARTLGGGAGARPGLRTHGVDRTHAAGQGCRRDHAGGADGPQDPGAARKARRDGGLLSRLFSRPHALLVFAGHDGRGFDGGIGVGAAHSAGSILVYFVSTVFSRKLSIV